MIRWGHYDLTRLVRYAKAGPNLSGLARCLGVPRADVDLALWAKLGRGVPEACDVLNSRDAA